MNDQEYRAGVLRELREIRATLKVLLKEVRAQNEDGPACPKCGSSDLEDTGNLAAPRSTCCGCGVSFAPSEAVMNG